MSMVEKETKVVNENKMMVNMTKEALYDFLFIPRIFQIQRISGKYTGTCSCIYGNLLVYNRKSEWHRSGALSGGSGNIPWRHTVPA